MPQGSGSLDTPKHSTLNPGPAGSRKRVEVGVGLSIGEQWLGGMPGNKTARQRAPPVNDPIESKHMITGMLTGRLNRHGTMITSNRPHGDSHDDCHDDCHDS